MPVSQKILIPVVILAILGAFSVFQVKEYEQAIVFEFRKIKRSDFEPGLHFKLPFINNVQKFEKRLLNLDLEPQRFLTSEKKDVIVDYYVKWRIIDVVKFYTATRGMLMACSVSVLAVLSVTNSVRAQYRKWLPASARRYSK